MECVQLTRLCKHMKKARSSQAAILVHELTKSQFLPVSIIKTTKFDFDVLSAL